MESSSWPESLPSHRRKAIQELSKGQELTHLLREMLRQPVKTEAGAPSMESIAVKILGTFDATLSILSSYGSDEVSHAPASDIRSPSSLDGRKSEDSGESIKTTTPVKNRRGCYKRRKTLETRTKITSTLIDDGHAWRKYGQKEILNAKHQRNYYRCTHKFDQGCQATKQVQKTEEEPPRYKITYHGHHTCRNLLKAPQIILDSPSPRDSSVLLSFETKGLVEQKQVEPYFPSIKHEQNEEGFAPQGLSHHQSSTSSEYYLPEDVITFCPSGPMSMISSGSDHADMLSSGVYSSTASTYEMDHVFMGNVGFDDFPYELCS